MLENADHARENSKDGWTQWAPALKYESEDAIDLGE